MRRLPMKLVTVWKTRVYLMQTTKLFRDTEGCLLSSWLLYWYRDLGFRMS